MVQELIREHNWRDYTTFPVIIGNIASGIRTDSHSGQCSQCKYIHTYTATELNGHLLNEMEMCSWISRRAQNSSGTDGQNTSVHTTPHNEREHLALSFIGEESACVSQDNG